MESNRTTIFVYGRINATDSASSIHSPDLDLDIRIEAADPKMQLDMLLHTLRGVRSVFDLSDGYTSHIDIFYIVSGGDAPVSRIEFLRMMRSV